MHANPTVACGDVVRRFPLSGRMIRRRATMTSRWSRVLLREQRCPGRRRCCAASSRAGISTETSTVDAGGCAAWTPQQRGRSPPHGRLRHGASPTPSAHQPLAQRGSRPNRRPGAPPRRPCPMRPTTRPPAGAGRPPRRATDEAYVQRNSANIQPIVPRVGVAPESPARQGKSRRISQSHPARLVSGTVADTRQVRVGSAHRQWPAATIWGSRNRSQDASAHVPTMTRPASRRQLPRHERGRPGHHRPGQGDDGGHAARRAGRTCPRSGSDRTARRYATPRSRQPVRHAAATRQHASAACAVRRNRMADRGGREGDHGQRRVRRARAHPPSVSG